MAKTVAAFRADDTLTQGELAAVVAGLTKHSAGTVADPGAAVTVTQLDARLVRALDLSDAAAAFTAGAQAAGLATPSRFGTETVARMLGLRTNHPAAHDDLELLPTDPVTRAETAYSVAQILRFKGWETQFVEDAAATFELPAARRLADARAEHGRPLHRLPLRLGRHEREAGVAVRTSRRTAASTAPASSGASTSCRPTPAAPRSPRRSRDARPTR